MSVLVFSHYHVIDREVEVSRQNVEIVLDGYDGFFDQELDSVSIGKELLIFLNEGIYSSSGDPDSLTAR